MKDLRITQARAAIRLAATELAEDDTARITCPFCGGGRSKDAAFYVTRTGGSVLYVCHRASCGKRGRLSLAGYVQNSTARKVAVHQPWTGRLTRVLPPAWEARAASAICGPDRRETPYYYGLYGNADDTQSVVWLLRDVYDRRIGVQTRTEKYGRKIVLSHKEGAKSLHSYFQGSDSLWIVEDCLSAAAVSAWGPRAVALLGTYLHDDVRDDITRFPTSGYIVALDPGAEKAAALVKSRLSCYTTRPVHVLYIQKDIKDMTYDEQRATILERGRI